jgi:hypothetical protein
MRWFALLLVLVAAQMRAEGLKFGEGWTREDTWRQAGVATLQVIDCLQTREAFSHPGFKEQNPILGSYPSMGRINNICAAAIGGHILISTMLSAPWRATFQYGTMFVEGLVVIDNHRMGIRIGMRF